MLEIERVKFPDSVSGILNPTITVPTNTWVSLGFSGMKQKCI